MRSKSDPDGWSIERVSTKKDASTVALWLRPDLCAHAQRGTSMTSIGSALFTVWKTLAGVHCGWTKGVQAAIWAISSCDANVVSRVASMRPRSLK